MCGIVAYVGTQPSAPLLLDSLRRLEYRGYDSAGLAVHNGASIEAVRAVGKLCNLERALSQRPIDGTTGIGHTRWATHGAPSEVNAHPHIADAIAVVHNGIIENHLPLRRTLEGQGRVFQSDTDTEIIAHLVAVEVTQGAPLTDAIREALKRVEGSYAIAVMSQSDPNFLVVAKSLSPLILGLGEGENFCASDIPALLPYTREMVFLEDGEMAVLRKDEVLITTLQGARVEREATRIEWSPVMAEKAGYKHFMLKEIMEQPRALEDTLRGRLNWEKRTITEEEIGLDRESVGNIERVVLTACGTSHHAALIGRNYIENLSGLPATVELASELRERDTVLRTSDLVVAVSQSGETIDTMAAAKKAKAAGAQVLAVSNVIGSAIPRMATASFYTHAGPEIGVASTKCFSTQVANLLMLAMYLGHRRGVLSDGRCAELMDAVARVPQLMNDVLLSTRQLVMSIARRYHNAQDVLYLGRGLSYPLALEGALKLKEISYVHAEGYAAGEMKHGPIALIDTDTPVICLVPEDRSYSRTLGNLQEARARQAQVIAIATEGDGQVMQTAHDVVEIPRVTDELYPLLAVLPLQLYAYYVADMKGTDVDQPRNLAKTVTVE